MFPLIRSVYTINRRMLFQASPFLILWLVQLVIAQRSGNHTAVVGYIVTFEVIFTAVFTLQGFFQPVEEFILSLPVSRSQVVRAKYLSSLLGLFTGLALPLLTISLAHLLFPASVPVFSHRALEIGGLIAIYLIFVIFFFLPFIYQFGPEKGSICFCITLVLLIVVCLTWKGLDGYTQIFRDFNSGFLEYGTFTFSIIAGVLVFGVFSVLFSIWIYRKKVTIGGHPLSVSKIRTALHL
jgi:hypothetical protein